MKVFRAHTHILQIAGKFAHSASVAGMHKTEEAENRKGVQEDHSRLARAPHKELLSAGTRPPPFCSDLNRGHFFSRFPALCSLFLNPAHPMGWGEVAQLDMVPQSTHCPVTLPWFLTLSSRPGPSLADPRSPTTRSDTEPPRGPSWELLRRHPLGQETS